MSVARWSGGTPRTKNTVPTLFPTLSGLIAPVRPAVDNEPACIRAASLLGELAALPWISAATCVANLDARALPFLPMQIRKDGSGKEGFDAHTARWFQARHAQPG
jgi:hypothetical protein